MKVKPTKPYSERIIEIKEAIDTTDTISDAKTKLGITPDRLDYTGCPSDIMTKKRPETLRQAEKWVETKEFDELENMILGMEKIGLVLRLKRLGRFIARQL